MSTRRQFIRQSLAIGAGLMLHQSLFSQNKNKSDIHVICIGAGFAGLSAAYRLKQKGYKVTVLEINNRVGGRVFTHNIHENLQIELGAEWVGNSHTRIQELCAEFGLTLENNQFDTHLIYKGEYAPAGKWDYSDQWKNKLNHLLENYSNLSEEDMMALDKYDWWRYLINNGCDARDLDIRELLDSTDFGESLRHVSAFAALAEYAESSEKNEMDLKIKGGNSMLAEKLADAIGRENILLNHEVIQIDQKEVVRIECKGGKAFTADKVICAIPTFALNKIKWLPELPKEKQDAILQLQYCRINKHATLYNKRFWKDESFDLITDSTPQYFYHATKNQKNEKGVLIAYSIGDKAPVMANRSNELNALDIQSVLQPHFPELDKLVNKQVNYYWGDNALSKGAYALYGINQWYTLKPTLSEPFIHTHFAGEHIADWQGFMEGAINTGEDAADAIG